MARKKATEKTTEARVETQKDDSVVLGDSHVEVRYFDGQKRTFELFFAGKIVRFVDGVATVDPELAVKLRDGGYVK